MAIVGVVALGAGSLAYLSTASAPSLAGDAPGQILQKSLGAARNAGAVHVVGLFNDLGEDNAHATMDLTPSGGTATLSRDGQTMNVVLVGEMAYFKADAAFFLDSGVPASAALLASDRWFSIPLGESNDLEQLAEIMTSSSVIDNLLSLDAPVKVPSYRNNLVFLQGNLPDTALNSGTAGDAATIWVSKTAPFLPVQIAFFDARSGTSLTFSNWGEHLTVTAPAGAIPLSSLEDGTGQSSSL